MEQMTRDQGPRSYKSRRNRPCDLCRTRKIACRIDCSPPCTFCQSRGSECTFIEKPPAKKRRALSTDPLGSNNAPSSTLSTTFTWDWNDAPPLEFDSTIFGDLALFEDVSAESGEQSDTSITGFNGKTQSSKSGNIHSPEQRRTTERERRLWEEGFVLHGAHMPPDTGHLSRHVVAGLSAQDGRIKLPQLTLQGIDGSDMLGQKLKGNVPVLLYPDQQSPSPLPQFSDRSVSWSDISDLLSAKQCDQLKSLYFQFIHAAFPVLQENVQLGNGRDHSISDKARLALAASLYATAIPFAMHDDHLCATLTNTSSRREQLYSIAVTTILEQAHRPSIELLQASLLLLQKGPTAQHYGLTPAFAWLTSFAVTMAKSIGLQYDCSACNIPGVEKQTRTRLWWATFVMDTWVSLDSPGGRSISPDDYDVPPLQLSNGATTSAPHLVGQELNHFCQLVTMSRLLSQIQTTYYTVRAAKDTRGNLFRSLDLARPIRAELVECRQQLNTGLSFKSGNETGVHASIHIASCTVSITLFRALIRPIQHGDINTSSSLTDSQRSAVSAVLAGSVNSAREAVRILEEMVAVVGPWNSFWHSWSQGNFAIVSTFFVQLLSVSKSQDMQQDMTSEVLELVSRWKRAIRVGAGNGGWGHSLMSLALTRLDALLNHVPP
ncbi:hypothetical protein PV08_05419 [Exophiala spinifera]|uniref:Zn(2)-C6 fungal-type domain-containing protein n=1 Tax=Exophiala spinifera TaxID=91928 RepID=A0A0D2B8X9_9EURO|nr:uncharacterized protein PV08_05419 [Exophiala spinifera]KIW15373.1 hypothetical protein PV08_05419 [Exophiala spinifera]